MLAIFNDIVDDMDPVEACDFYRNNIIILRNEINKLRNEVFSLFVAHRVNIENVRMIFMEACRY